MIKTYAEGLAAFAEDRDHLEAAGIHLPGVRGYYSEAHKRNFRLAMDEVLGMDAQQLSGTLQTDPNSAVPAMLTTMIDPQVFKILFSPNKAAEIFGEVKKGNWLDETAMFPTVEHTGEVSSYGDFNENGRAGANTNWPQRQQYLFQTMKEYGERELERAGLARINWISEIDQAAATVLNKFSNFTYFFGVQGLQNFGLLNDPNLTAPIAPAPKTYGGTKWIVNGVVKATATEIYADIQATFANLVVQAGGLIDSSAKMTLALSNQIEVALLTTNNFNVNVEDMLKKNFPNMTVKTAVQYGALTVANPQGLAAGNLMQLIVDSVEGQGTGYCSFGEKMRAHPIIRATSSFKQKCTSGTWGAIVRQPFGISQMLGL